MHLTLKWQENPVTELSLKEEGKKLVLNLFKSKNILFEILYLGCWTLGSLIISFLGIQIHFTRKRNEERFISFLCQGRWLSIKGRRQGGEGFAQLIQKQVVCD